MVQYTYDAYGNTTVNTGSPLNNPYQYNAEYTDSSTGNQYLRARYYDPASGRFLTKDTYLGTVDSPLSRNLYTYVRNNPLNLIDPSGYFFEQIFGVGAGAGRAVWDGVGGLFTGKGFSGFKSGWNEGYKAGSDVGRKWDNAIANTIDNSRNNHKINKIEKIDRDLQGLQDAFTSSTSGKDKAKIRKQIEELEQKRRKLCDQAEKIQKQMDDRGKTNYAKIPDAFIVSLPEKTLEEEYYQINENKQNNVRVKVSDNNITIDVHVNFTGDVDAPISGSDDTFRELTIAGIEAWSGNYNAFGYDTNVNVNVVEDSDGLIINLTDSAGRAYAIRGVPWKTTDNPRVELYTGASDGTMRTPTQVSSTAAHEFGHVLGLGDAYGEDDRPSAAIADSGTNGIMRNHWNGINISDKDIQMLIYAWSNNEWQSYQSYGSYDRSPALDK